MQELGQIGHEMFAGNPKTGFASVTAAARDGDKLIAIFDPRRVLRSFNIVFILIAIKEKVRSRS